MAAVDLSRHAEALVRRGWAVHPLLARSKKPPARSRGFYDATRDVAQVRDWWAAQPSRNIGIRTGSASRIWVLDVDGPRGESSLAELEREHGPVMATFTVRTGNGRQMYFAWPVEVEVRNDTDLRPGIDVRGEGGYVVGPGSVHPSGRIYEIAVDAPVAAAPPWLLDLVAGREAPPPPATPSPGPVLVTSDDERQRHERSIAKAQRELASASPGGRNRLLNRWAYMLAGQGLDVGTIELELRGACSSWFGVPEGDPFTEAEYRQTVTSGARAGGRRPLPPPQPPPRRQEPRTRLELVHTPERKRTERPPKREGPFILEGGWEPLRAAEGFVRRRFTDDEGRLMLRRWRDEWYRYVGGRYSVVGEEELLASLWRFLDSAQVMTEDGLRRLRPNNSKVANARSALIATGGLIPSEVEPPTWLRPSPTPPWAVPCSNGLLDMESGELTPHSPDLFSLRSVACSWVPEASPPSAWLSFLERLFDDDWEAVEALQDWFGYCLSPDTSQQKLLMIVGPPRSGKGTIARVLTQLVGPESVCGPTITSLGGAFGFEAFLGRSLAIVPDARVTSRVDLGAVVEHLLAITGEDKLDIARKHKASLTVRLPTRIVILSNDVPRFPDPSGALARRTIMLKLTQSFFGREDLALQERLLGELPQILRWAVEGWRRLQARGYFVLPQSSREAIESLEELASPVRAFVDEECEVDSDAWVEVGFLYERYATWCGQSGMKATGRSKFSADLISAFPAIRRVRPRDGDSRSRRFVGLTTRGAMGG